MKLVDHLVPGLILTNPTVTDKWQLLELMADTLAGHPLFTDHEHATASQIHEAVLEREHQGTTGLGSGFALPHARIAGLSGLYLCMATFADGLDYESIDGQPVNVVALAVTPDEQPTLALKASSSILGMLGDEAVANYLVNAGDGQAIYDYLLKKQYGLSDVVTARDIMREPMANIPPDMPIRKLVQVMAERRFDVAAVVEDDLTLVGEISCDTIFQYGIPDFFTHLQSVSFIARFDPFEKYFKDEKHVLVRDIMTRDYAAVSPDATLLEVVFQLVVKHHPRAYVVEDGKRIGTIDRSVVLNRVINF